jgi:hypothetical protein
VLAISVCLTLFSRASVGIYGQANVGHIVRDVDIAGRYLTYWNALSLDPPGRSRSRISYSDSSEASSASGEEKDEPTDNEIMLEQAARGESLESIEEEPVCIDEAECAASFSSISKSSTVSDIIKQEPMTHQIEKDQPDLDGPLEPNAIKVIFSPRSSSSMLEFYADRMKDATTSVHLTAPFGVSQQFAEVLMGGAATATNLSTSQDGLRRSPRIARKNSEKVDVAQSNETSLATLLRYILFDKKPSEKSSAKAKAIASKNGKPHIDYFDFKNSKENRIAWGAVLSDDEDEEDLTGLTAFVDFVHLKCLLIGKLRISILASVYCFVC